MASGFVLQPTRMGGDETASNKGPLSPGPSVEQDGASPKRSCRQWTPRTGRGASEKLRVEENAKSADQPPPTGVRSPTPPAPGDGDGSGGGSGASTLLDDLFMTAPVTDATFSLSSSVKRLKAPSLTKKVSFKPPRAPTPPLQEELNPSGGPVPQPSPEVVEQPQAQPTTEPVQSVSAGREKGASASVATGPVEHGKGPAAGSEAPATPSGHAGETPQPGTGLQSYSLELTQMMKSWAGLMERVAEVDGNLMS
ncbi:uncharacterized protein [Miscanthus floridulus]|uniref:uncharacterized protein n=1 Tax=Miscanthus floridulus TaxID=154761 RepID=UPI00345A9C12